ncbi:acetyltransferase [Kiloniella laminariae]|uniref:acetyltransferase n=1 Tax=Kiloniella laminariae TaxID=454162 RepID=UPI00036BD9A5|nr:acetyltransferase [Kiloniella laminariae]
MSRNQKKLVIFGAGEFATLARFYFTQDGVREVIAFCVDDDQKSSGSLEGLPVITFSQLIREYPPAEFDAHVAVSYTLLNQRRQEKFQQLKEAGYKLASYICTKSVFWDDLQVGENCFILENQTIQPQVKIGDNVMIWSGNHIGHGTQILDHSYIASHVVISGHCEIGKRCFIGVNATLKDFTKVGDDCVISMGANVTKNMIEGSVAVQESASIHGPDHRLSRTIKRSYFGIKQ